MNQTVQRIYVALEELPGAAVRGYLSALEVARRRLPPQHRGGHKEESHGHP